MKVANLELYHVAEVFNGKTPSRTEQKDSGHPVLKIKDLDETGRFRGKFSGFVENALADLHKKKWLRVGDTLILNAAHSASHVASKTALISSDCEGALATGEWLIIRPDLSRLDASYLYNWINQPSTRKRLSDIVNGIHLYPKDVARMPLLLPPLEEQKRIAAVLDKSDALRRKRQEALRLTDDFLRSTFLDMFGDLRTNSKDWQMRPLADGVAEFEGGRNFNPTDTARSDGFKVLKVSAVTSGEYAANESKHFSESDEVPAHYLVRPNDLLISRANTAELVGAVAYVWETQGTEVLPDKLWRFVWPEQPTLEPLFMLHLARSPYFRDQLIQRATGSSGSMKNIGKAKMLEIPVPYPPYTLQERFSNIAKQLQKTALRSSKASQETETLFSALQQRAFSGQL